MQKDEFLSNICTSIDKAICKRSHNKLIIHPLGDTKYTFHYPVTTGDMAESSIGVSTFDIEKQVWSGGVMTREQVFALRDFLDEWCHQN